ncbi:trypsin CFT-1-like [Hyposmocoma kahamanoa]|uniref:trypsin CFT-1-like n=1 Tax=Hyposmocoma kahamanoa TaxID=1477025 RepID=UPI000E6D6DEC|nr:trypsin CFT-1-like [Hyposmocoma kahamanoa]
MFPFAVQIIARGSPVCAGTLLTVQNVLSAAQCFFEGNQLIGTNHLNVRAGTVNNNSGGTSIPVLRLAVHERYNNPLRDNDIAVLRTSTQFTLGTTIGVAFIPYQNDVLPDNSPVIQIGWGATSVNSTQMSPVLRHVVVMKINRAICASRYQQLGAGYVINDNMMCAGRLDIGGAGACHGDVGGPVLFNANIVVGIMSWGHECGHPQYPSVNVRLARYSNWLNTTVTNINGSSSVSESRIILLFTLICAMLHWQSR